MPVLTTAGALTVATIGFFITAWRFTRLAMETESDSVWQRFARIWQAYTWALASVVLVDLGPGLASFTIDLGTWVVGLW